MATLTHSSMSKTAPIQTQPQISQPKPFVVDDLSQFEGVPEQKPEPAMVNTEQASQAPVNKKLEDILFLGKTTKLVEIAGHSFEISTMSHREHSSLMRELAKIGETANLFDIRVYTLAAVIKKVDGISFDEVGGIPEKVNVVDSMQLSVIEKLFASYDELKTEADNLVTSDNIKKS